MSADGVEVSLEVSLRSSMVVAAYARSFLCSQAGLVMAMLNCLILNELAFLFCFDEDFMKINHSGLYCPQIYKNILTECNTFIKQNISALL